jgi:cysteine desulfurase/selenocysteine lyase
MAVTAQRRLDVEAVRADFPYLEELVDGRPFAFLDSAASAQKPRAVIDGLAEFYRHSYANVHRGVYPLADRATAGYEAAREKVRAFLNAASEREIVFTRGTTESLNLVAYAWGLDNLGPGDVVVTTDLDHHSNYVPWQYIAGRTGATFATIPVDDQGELVLEELDRIAGLGQVKVVAFGLVSNALGTVNPAARLIAWAKEQGAISVVDAAQAAPHRAIDVQALGCDFLALSAHKLCGPTSVGALYGRAALLERMSPFNLGGHMIRQVRPERTTWGELPAKFEAGTAPIVEAHGFGLALDYLGGIGLDAIAAHEHELLAYALPRLAEVPGIQLYGPPADRRTGVVAFNLGDIHPHDVAQVLGFEGVCVRAGHHCTQPLLRRLDLAATNRASFYLYTTTEEIDRLVAGLHLVNERLG